MEVNEQIRQDYTFLIDKIQKGEAVSYDFDENSRLQIDKKMPFLLVFRHQFSTNDLDIESLVKGEPSYLILKNHQVPDNIRQFLYALMKHMAAEFGSFLLLDIWLSEENDHQIVVRYPKGELTATAETFTKGFKLFSKVHKRLRVRSEPQDHQGFSPLVNPKILKKTGSQLVALEIPSLFSHQESGDAYPVLFRTFKQHFSEVLRKGLYNFIRVQTSLKIDSYYVLGRSSVDDAFWKADRQLSEIEHSFDFLLLVSAINTEQAWEEFVKSKYQRKPVFYYRILHVDPEKLKRKIYGIDLDKIHDPALSFLLRDKRNELDKQLNMLIERNSSDFLYSSVRLYKTIDQHLLNTAEYILNTFSCAQEEEETLPPEYFAQEVRKEFAYFRQQDSTFASKIHIDEAIPGLMVSRGQLYMTPQSYFRESRIRPLIQHEVGTHILTFHNGKQQPMQLMRYGLADYDELQEGLAVMAEYLAGGLDVLRMRLLAARVVAANAMTRGESFVHTFNLLHEHYYFTKKTTFGIVTRIYQAGGFTKDVIYLRGLIELLNYLKHDGSLDSLYMGKIAVKHIKVVQELRERGILKPPAIKPRYLDDPVAQQKLNLIKQGIELKELITS